MFLMISLFAIVLPPNAIWHSYTDLSFGYSLRNPL